ncbi:hypothetical protein Tco_0301778, partial [Tanacetum coccineum]
RVPPRLTEVRAPESPCHFLRIPMRPLAPLISLSESTPPVLVPIICRTARMAVRVLHAMSSGLFASMAEVAAMSESAFRKSEEDADEEDEEIEGSMDSDNLCEDAEDQGPTAKDEDPAAEE